jgi:hypothetical protein
LGRRNSSGDRVDETGRRRVVEPADHHEHVLQEQVGRRIDVDLRRFVHRRNDNRHVAVGETMRLAVRLPHIRDLGPHQLECTALDGAVGDCAHLREGHCIAHGERLGAHAECESARKHGQQYRQPQSQHQCDAGLVAANRDRSAHAHG